MKANNKQGTVLKYTRHKRAQTDQARGVRYSDSRIQDLKHLVNTDARAQSFVLRDIESGLDYETVEFNLQSLIWRYRELHPQTAKFNDPAGLHNLWWDQLEGLQARLQTA